MRTIIITADAVRHLLPFTSSDEKRPNLAAICIEPSGIAIATDGHTLLAIRGAAAQHADRPDTDTLVRFDKTPPVRAQSVRIVLPDVLTYSGQNGRRYNGETTPFTVEYLDAFGRVIGAGTAVAIEGPYPGWRRILPDRTYASGPSVTFNARLLKRFDVVAKDVGAAVRILHTESEADMLAHPAVFGACVVDMGNPDYLGLMMPLARKLDAGHAMPEWLTPAYATTAASVGVDTLEEAA